MSTDVETICHLRLKGWIGIATYMQAVLHLTSIKVSHSRSYSCRAASDSDNPVVNPFNAAHLTEHIAEHLVPS